MTEESKLLLSRIEHMAKKIVDISMPESLLEDIGVEIWDLCEQIEAHESKLSIPPFSPEINESIAKTIKLGEKILADIEQTRKLGESISKPERW